MFKIKYYSIQYAANRTNRVCAKLQGKPTLFYNSGHTFFFVFQSMGTFFTRKLFFTTLTKFVRLEDFFPKNNLTIERGKTQEGYIQCMGTLARGSQWVIYLLEVNGDARVGELGRSLGVLYYALWKVYGDTSGSYIYLTIR